MMKTTSISAVLALAFAGAACASPSEDTEAMPQEAPAVEASSEDDGFGGFNLMVPGDDLETAEDGWNLGVEADVTEDGFVIPDGAIEDRLGDVAELPTGDVTQPEISAELPLIQPPQEEPIRID